MTILDGKQTSAQIKEELRVEVEERKRKGLKVPHLAAILVGEDGASMTYVNSKVKSCKAIGYDSTLIRLDSAISEEKLLETIDELNDNTDIDGFIVQLPLPKHIDEQKVIERVHPEKDVDGFHPENFGRMALGLPTFIPATPNGIMELLRRYEVPTEGKSCIVIGRSHIVGLPMSILMGLNDVPGNCTVTLTHSRTKNLKEICQNADILIVALGKPEFVTGEMVKEGAVVIDVGITRVPDETKKSGFRLLGDVHYDSVAPRTSFITPVPGGVGPMTIASLLQNTLKAVKRKE
ncbi:MAG TPA: bifunctional methylenetetrahydrofolate dehydrogenase/methenyltetrahydrofolate cyclohydrolase FolD [Flavobacteriales bacterium]|jgi:methylenetetrahydrofolate dehydrogenase (NADP+)/methenyltetrahydrofolate cyclohydrolase|nr:bifunctional methylenetetrahydrofolate dehydrogenase/methenyltetrahydrofolate cyclohydrolase FolD [Flavobacteriales bacterium]